MKYLSFVCILALLPCSFTGAAQYKPIVLSMDHEHDKWNTQPKDIVRCFRAFTVSFDGADDSDYDGDEEEVDKIGQPEWVAYQINKIDSPLEPGPARPSPWISDKSLTDETIAPKDNTYRNSGYHRGHLCMKQIAWRLGENADWNTHTTLNACPQLEKFNARIWLDMEYKTQEWADRFGKIWVICGPLFDRDQDIAYIGDQGEKSIPVPHAYYKIVIREDGGQVDALAFIYPHKEIKKKNGAYPHAEYLVAVDRVESLTGLDFLTRLPDEQENQVEKKKGMEIW